MKKKFKISLPIIVLIIFYLSFDKDSEKQNHTKFEWIDINGEMFFRVKTANYLVDKQKLVVFMTCSPDFTKDFEFFFTVFIYKKERLRSKKILQNIQKRSFKNANFFENIELSQNLNIFENMDDENLSDIKIYFFVSFKTNHKTNKEIVGQTKTFQVNIKKSYTGSRKIYICSEMNYLEDNDYEDFEWWVEMNKMIGYDKIVIYNNSIPNNFRFNGLFERNKNIVDIVQLHYLPNLVNKTVNKKYFHHMNDLIVRGEYNGQNLLNHGIEAMIMHECIYSYRDQANLLLMIDKDETFIPVKLKKLENDHSIFRIFNEHNLKNEHYVNKFANEYLNYENCDQSFEPESSFLRKFVDKLYQEKNIPRNYSIYFPQVVFIKQDFVDALFRQFKNVFDSNLDLGKISFPLKVCFIFNCDKIFFLNI